jgi:hypothetical protein
VTLIKVFALIKIMALLGMSIANVLCTLSRWRLLRRKRAVYRWSFSLLQPRDSSKLTVRFITENMRKAFRRKLEASPF